MEILLTNRQRTVPVKMAWLRKAAQLALAECLLYSDDDVFALQQLPEVEATIVSDAVIARVHQDFMDIPGPTDVITFEHGEIVISAETAESYARQQGHSVEEELALYVIHGLLHLNGYDDMTAAAKKRMFRVQERIWKKVRSAAGKVPGK